MPTKQCTSCKEVKSLDDFYPIRARNTWRPNCKACCALQAKRRAEGERRQAVPAEEIPLSIRVVSYRTVIDRMVGLGIMSDKTAQESLARVNELEKAEA